jgi:hypothetical protein
VANQRQIPLIAYLFALGIGMFLLACGLLINFKLDQPRTPLFEVRDPNSPTVVRMNRIRGVSGTAGLSCEISADGLRPTQLAGWPRDRIAMDAAPTALTWHTNPDWVEILLSSGERLKLTWDTSSAIRARANSDTHMFLDPKFEVLPK